MSRHYADPVEVRAQAEKDGFGAFPPDSFLWRGRLYVVRSVLGRWRERRAWWNELPARALHGEADLVGEPAVAGRSSEFAAERVVWRVEASSGRHSGTGIYDLCQGSLNSWSLLRVAD